MYFGMEPRTYCFIAVFVGSGAFAFLAVATPITTDPEALTVVEQAIFLDCKHPDYRTYIACLKRQKRHHSDRGHNGQMENYDDHCLESCLPKCEKDNTMHDCYKICGHCITRSKHKHQIITEYETECEFGVCSNRTAPPPTPTQPIKINTTIHIDNHFNLNNSCPCPPHKPCLCPPMPVPPPRPVIVAPRLVIDFSTLQLGGCQWPCYPGVPGWSNIDCSPCENPLTIHKCHASCRQGISGWNNMDCSPCENPLTIHKCHASCRQVNITNPCVSPECVGGTIGT